MHHIIVTRHAALAAYIVERGLAPVGTPVISRASAEDVEGKHVFGILPLYLAALALSVTEVPLTLREQDRDSEIGLDRLREIARAPVTYEVKRVQL